MDWWHPLRFFLCIQRCDTSPPSLVHWPRTQKFHPEWRRSMSFGGSAGPLWTAQPSHKENYWWTDNRVRTASPSLARLCIRIRPWGRLVVGKNISCSGICTYNNTRVAAHSLSLSPRGDCPCWQISLLYRSGNSWLLLGFHVLDCIPNGIWWSLGETIRLRYSRSLSLSVQYRSRRTWTLSSWHSYLRLCRIAWRYGFYLP